MTETRASYEATTGPTDAHPTLAEQLARVHALRLAHAEMRAKRDALYAALEAEHRALLDLCISIGEQLTDAEAELRELALAAYAATGSKQPAPGVSIRVVRRVFYDDRQALEWAREHGLALALDRRAFERIARADPAAVLGVADLPEEATATIATDLAPYVGEGSAAPGREVRATH